MTKPELLWCLGVLWLLPPPPNRKPFLRCLSLLPPSYTSLDWLLGAAFDVATGSPAANIYPFSLIGFFLFLDLEYDDPGVIWYDCYNSVLFIVALWWSDFYWKLLFWSPFSVISLVLFRQPKPKRSRSRVNGMWWGPGLSDWWCPLIDIFGWTAAEI